ncbi:amidohydrolase family protein [Komagataeibacter intermedius]|uniref:Chlorohydrolase n=2 Tax=Komagataeibacter intermedius TaxID=66229 RepID=A0A0N0MES5_9PROT|nr:amidohydrolase family protein [Komagataeibacter intermedius]KPH86796.1 chlorohydrolase [Komagataeibacter intermedius AF2]MCF3637041.1 amidohydrolase family protein [Komagataeibacter intermedius]GAN86671.1 guanine deaminase [Komagataeibacter intermedius TF2]GBQ67316.1 putative guanine deaminase [Komagataeibacter intermedius NRIC 0521]
MGQFVIRGQVINPVTPDRTTLTDCVVHVGADGRIVARHASDSPMATQMLDHAARQGMPVRTLSASQVLTPGFTDLHVHAPQWPQMGRALDLPLRDWLEQRTFPLEARFADPAFAAPVYDEMVRTLLANGTTTAVFFATIHEESSLLLARTCLRHGLRALVGLVAMDDPALCPPTYRNASVDQALAATRRFIHAVRALPGNEGELVRPMVTPRFIPACTDNLLRGLGELAVEEDCLIQTHCSESDWEHDYVRQRTGVNDTMALDRFGLLRRGTVLAHSCHMTAADMALVQARGAAIAHCPLSNAYFAGAVLPLRAAWQAGVHVGLGTDLSGGYSPSIAVNAAMAVTASRMLDTGTDPARAAGDRGRPGARLTFAEGLWLATRGGTAALDIAAGQFDAGQAFDAIMIDRTAPGSNILPPVHGETDRVAADVVQQILCNIGRPNIRTVWVAGRKVHDTEA